MSADYLPWLTPPDWSTPIIERLEWKTDVLTAFNGSEQRIALCQTPRRWFEFAILLEGESVRREFEGMLWSWGAKPWALPIWTDATATTASTLSGANSVSVDTATFDFYADGMAMLLHNNEYELLQVLDVAGDHLTLAQPTARAWSAGTTIIPVRIAYLEPSQQISRFKGDTLYGTVRMMLDDVNDHPAESAADTYRGYPVLTTPSDWTADLTVDYMRKMQTVDFGVGGVYRDDESGQPALLSSHHWTLDSRANIAAFRSFLYARRGRLSAVWLPSFLSDLSLAAPVTDTATQISTEHCKYTDLYNLKRNRRDIRIELTNGTVLYRRITACTEISSTVEQLTLNAALGVDVGVDDIERISFMTFSRLDADAIELAWRWGDLVEAKMNWRTTNDDV